MTRHDPAGGVDDAATLERASALGDAESAGLSEGRATTHWAENTGKVPAVWIAVDIPKP